MNKRLRDNISSSYVEAANRLNSRRSRRRIVAYVESYDDVFFWRTVLSRFETDKLFFEVMLPSHKTLERGKKSVLMNLLYNNRVGRDMIACVDADYDYLIDGASASSRQMKSSPYVFHTYVYAIENYQCYAPSLHNVCVMVTLNDHDIFDFKTFMRRYSEAIYPLFVWSIWHYRNGTYSQFTMNDFNRTIEIGGFSLSKPELAIQHVQSKVSKRLHSLEERHADDMQSYNTLKQELRALGVTPQTTYLYIQGHYLMDKVIRIILGKVCSRLIRERENEIRRQAVHSTQMRNELSCYSNSTQDIVQALRRNTGYITSPPFRRLQADIERFLASHTAAQSARDA